jgi:hypothetical protein
MATFQQAFVSLLSVAPSPLFPRARTLYLRKYPLETTAVASGHPLGRFRTFLLDEDVQESAAGVLRIRAQAFALVHWQAPQTNAADYLAYLRSRWQLSPETVSLASEGWFRDGGAFAVFRSPAVMERAFQAPEVSQ